MDANLNPAEDGPVFTVKEFYLHYRISRSLYYALQKQGEGPHESRIGKCVRIFPQDRKDWERKCRGEFAQLLTMAPRLSSANDDESQNAAPPRSGD